MSKYTRITLCSINLLDNRFAKEGVSSRGGGTAPMPRLATA